MAPQATTKPAVCTEAQDLVRLAEAEHEPGKDPHTLLCDTAHAVDQMYLRMTAAESRVQHLEAKLYAIALMLRP